MILFAIGPVLSFDREWVRFLTTARWGSEIVVTRGRIHKPAKLKGFIAHQERNRVGLITFRMEDRECEIITLNSLVQNQGIGSALIDAVHDHAIELGCHRLWLITTNDNHPALGFYQKRGFCLKALYPEAITHSRQLKPEIPMTGIDGIHIRDEIELSMDLTNLEEESTQINDSTTE